MELNLSKWWLDQIQKTNGTIALRLIKQRARKLSKNSMFKASKGWLDKFMKRYDMEQKIDNLLNMK